MALAGAPPWLRLGAAMLRNSILLVSFLLWNASAQVELPSCPLVLMKNAGNALCLSVNYDSATGCKAARLETQPCRPGDPAQIFNLRRITDPNTTVPKREHQEISRLYHPGSHCHIAVPHSTNPLERTNSVGPLPDLVERGLGWLTKIGKQTPYWTFEVVGGERDTVECGGEVKAKACHECPKVAGGCAGDCETGPAQSGVHVGEDGDATCMIRLPRATDPTTVSCGDMRRGSCSGCPGDCAGDCRLAGEACLQLPPEEVQRRSDHVCLVAGKPRTLLMSDGTPVKDSRANIPFTQGEWWNCDEEWLRYDPFKLWSFECTEDTHKALKPHGQETVSPFAKFTEKERLDAIQKLRPPLMQRLEKVPMNFLVGGREAFEDFSVRIGLFYFSGEPHVHTVAALLEAQKENFRDYHLGFGAFHCGTPGSPSEALQQCQAYNVVKRMTIGVFSRAGRGRAMIEVTGSTAKLLKELHEAIAEAAKAVPTSVIQANLDEVAKSSDVPLQVPIQVMPSTISSEEFKQGRYLVAFIAKKKGETGTEVQRNVLKNLPKLAGKLSSVGVKVGFADCGMGTVPGQASDYGNDNPAEGVDCAAESLTHVPDIRLYEQGRGSGQGVSALGAPFADVKDVEVVIESLTSTLLAKGAADGAGDETCKADDPSSCKGAP
mmetsp:Transcript_64062/g.119059  ORF Transcript_64062/g.119059 Transcript_64062/m.119059 type:complete len:662 (-) Transcript_64062:195-2180(-)